MYTDLIIHAINQYAHTNIHTHIPGKLNHADTFICVHWLDYTHNNPTHTLIYTHVHTDKKTHTHSFIYIYIYIYIGRDRHTVKYVCHPRNAAGFMVIVIENVVNELISDTWRGYTDFTFKGNA